MGDFNYDCLKTECTEADLDYKAEYKRLKTENAKLHEEIEWLRTNDLEMEKMRAQLDIVYLIFGGKNNG